MKTEINQRLRTMGVPAMDNAKWWEVGWVLAVVDGGGGQWNNRGSDRTSVDKAWAMPR